MIESNPIRKAQLNAEYLAKKEKARAFHKAVTGRKVSECALMEVRKNLIFDRIEGEVWKK